MTIASDAVMSPPAIVLAGGVDRTGQPAATALSTYRLAGALSGWAWARARARNVSSSAGPSQQSRDRAKPSANAGGARSPVDSMHVDAPKHQDNKAGHAKEKHG